MSKQNEGIRLPPISFLSNIQQLQPIHAHNHSSPPPPNTNKHNLGISSLLTTDNSYDVNVKRTKLEESVNLPAPVLGIDRRKQNIDEVNNYQRSRGNHYFHEGFEMNINSINNSNNTTSNSVPSSSSTTATSIKQESNELPANKQGSGNINNASEQNVHHHHHHHHHHVPHIHHGNHVHHLHHHETIPAASGSPNITTNKESLPASASQTQYQSTVQPQANIETQSQTQSQAHFQVQNLPVVGQSESPPPTRAHAYVSNEEENSNVPATHEITNANLKSKENALETTSPRPNYVKPETIITNSDILDTIKQYPRKNLGRIRYSSYSTSKTMLSSVLPKLNLSPSEAATLRKRYEADNSHKNIPLLPDLENYTNSTLEVRISFEALIKRDLIQERAVWGADVYTDDSDLVCVLIHLGVLRGSFGEEREKSYVRKESNKKDSKEEEEKVNFPLSGKVISDPPKYPADLIATVVILPPLKQYSGCFRYGLNSRSWGVHDGMSFGVLDVKWCALERLQL